jgi:formate dehydrogenase subunit gamma
MSGKHTLIDVRATKPDAASIIAARYDNKPDALLEILHDLQHEAGHGPEASLPVLAKALNLSRAEVHGVVTYYHYFRSEPPGRHVVQICRAESCKAMGSDALWSHACSHLGSDGQGTKKDGAFTVEPVYCLGLCAQSPAMTLDDKVHARVGIEKFDRLVARAGSAA